MNRIFCLLGLLFSQGGRWSPSFVVGQGENFQPVELVSENGRLDVTLTVDMLESFNGTKIAPAYNGATVGPTLRVKPGDIVSVTLVNNLAPPSALDVELHHYIMDPMSQEEDEFNVTRIYNRLDEFGNVYNPTYGFWGVNYVNLHFHGAEVSPSIERLDEWVGGGSSKTYTFQIPEDQDPGLEWYHNHVHGITSYAYMSNLFGFIVVEGTDHDITKAPGIEGATEVFMMLSEGLVNPDKSVPPFFPIVMSFDWVSAANGMRGEDTKYTFSQGETVLFRVASATVEPTIRLFIPGHTMVIVAHDGFPLPNGPEEVDVLPISGGNRVEFLVRFDNPGTFTMSRKGWAPFAPDQASCLAVFGIDAYPCVSYDVEQVVATIDVLPSDGDGSGGGDVISPSEGIELPAYSDRLNALAAKESVATKTIIQQVGHVHAFENIVASDVEVPPPGGAFGINNRLATPHRIEGTVTLGTCETWYVLSDPPFFEHPFHAHVAPFLVTQIDGVDVEKPFWRDTMMIGQNITIHICFDETRLAVGDVFPVHCHMPSHLDIGMLLFFEVVAPENDETTPDDGDGNGGNGGGSTTDPPAASPDEGDHSNDGEDNDDDEDDGDSASSKTASWPVLMSSAASLIIMLMSP